MSFNVNYSFNNGEVTGNATSFRILYLAIHAANYTQCTLSGTAQGLLYTTALNMRVGLFQNCRSLISVDLSNLDTSSVTSMENMFSGCSSLTTLDLSSFDTSSVTDISGMFTDCSRLEHIYVGDNWTIDNLNTSALGYLSVFSGCTSLPNFNSSYEGGYKAYVGEGGYLEIKPAPEPQEEAKPITGLKFENDGDVYRFVDIKAREDIEELRAMILALQ